MRFTAIQYASDGLIAMIVKHQIRMSTGTPAPALDAILILLNCFGNSMLGGCAIGVGGSRGNVALAFESFLQLGIRSTDVALQRVSAHLLVRREVVRAVRFLSRDRRGARFRSRLICLRTGSYDEEERYNQALTN